MMLDFEPILDRTASTRIVMIGEASHGTHDYYRWRDELTRRLIAEQNFSFVAVEGDWPDCERVNRAVTAQDADPADALHAFARWPTWMWANTDVLEFCRWLQRTNASRPARQRVGFHGLDVYSLNESLGILIDHARTHGDDLNAVWAAARCFEPYRDDPQGYAWATRFLGTDCEAEVLGLLGQARERAVAEDGLDILQNAEIVAGAERYYRTMMRGGGDSWNVRDIHMADTLDRLLNHYGPNAKAIVWAHNTHVGDARATDMAAVGTVNIGQLARERHGDDRVVLVGFGGYEGRVMAAPRWAAAREIMDVPPAIPGSVEDRMHIEFGPAAVIVFGTPNAPRWFGERLRHRAIGVVYDPELEQLGNYVPTILDERYDAFVWCDVTKPVSPLHAQPAPGELETYPTGV